MSNLDFPRLPPQRTIPAERLAHRQRLLERHVVASTGPTRNPWWRRKLVIVPAAVTVLVAATAAGQELLPGGLATQATTVSCYATVSLHGDTDIVGADGIADPAESCRNVWQSTGRNVPSELATCVTPAGAVAVFPSKDACRTLGLRPFMGISDNAREFAAFQDEAITAVTADRCRPREEIIEIIRQKLDAHSLYSWRIDDGGFGQPWAAGRPCAGLAFNHDKSIVIIVPETR